MKIPFDWLKKWVDVDISVQQLAEALTGVGLEVVDISYFQPEMDNVVVGEILKVKPHSNADNLMTCQVSDGRQIFAIVCGARNIKERDRVPLARVGATLPGGAKISKRRIRDEVSAGMLCSEKELGIGEGHEGILILPRDAKLGEKVEKILLSNPVMDVELTTNRSDCASIIGVAREVSAVLGKPLKVPDMGFAESDIGVDSLCRVRIDASDRCKRYAARVIQNVTVGPSPGWLVKKLSQVGMRPVNNVVDITNYVLAELGHPLHSFDYDKLSAHEIVVRCANAGEQLKCLDGIQVKMGAGDLVIADSEKPVALAGIIGGEETGVKEGTKNVLLESAYFVPGGIRKSAAGMNINTEASYRFERGVDVNNVITAINRAAQLLQKFCGGTIAGGIVDVYPEPFPGYELDFSPGDVNSVLGCDIPGNKVVEILQSLGFGCQSSPDNPDSVVVKVPSYRNDITGSIDIVEEVARVYGYNMIPSSMPRIQVSNSSSDEVFEFSGFVKAMMAKLGFFEVINFSLTGAGALEDAGKNEAPENEMLRISNPLVSEQSLLRTTLLPGLLSTVRRNLNHKTGDMKIFELGRVFMKDREKGKPPVERRMLSGCLSGARQESYWDETLKPVDFHYLKGIIQSVLDKTGIADYNFKHSKNPVFNPARSCDIIINNSSIGSFGMISGSMEKKYDFIFPVFAFDIDFDRLCGMADFKTKFKKIPRYPAMSRDISLLSPKGLTYDSIYAKIIESGSALINNIHLFDMYKGKQVKEGYQGMAFRIIYQSENRTLIDQEVNDLHQSIISSLEKSLSIIIRK